MSRWSERFEALTKGVDTKDTSDTCHRSDESESLGVKAVLGVNALETPTSAPVPPQSSIETTSAFLGSDSVDTCDSFDTSASSKIVVLDFETRNTGDVKLKAAGAWRYAADPATEILTATYHTDGEHHLWTPATGKRGPLASLAADSDTTFVCFSNFEIAVWEKIMVERFGFPPVPIDRWHDVQATCAYHALPRDLERALAALEMPVAKDKEGRRLVLALSRPEATSDL